MPSVPGSESPVAWPPAPPPPADWSRAPEEPPPPGWAVPQQPPPASAWSQAPQGPSPRPVSPPPSGRGPNASRHEVRAPLLGDGTWGWRQSLAGAAVAFAPEALLYLAARGVGSGSSAVARVTVGTAIALIASSVISYGWQIFAAWLFSLRRAAAGLRAWGFRKPTVAYFWTIPTALICVYAVNLVHDSVVHPRQQDIVEQFPHTGAGFLLFFVLAVVMAPFFEEMFFRGFLFKGFANSWGWFWGAVASSALFSLAHLQLDIFVPIFALGFALAWCYHRTGSLWTNITLHALFNAISTIVWYYAR
jgi:uncharacterized protein